MLDWLAISITLIGGLSIFLYGMNLMSDGIKKSAGHQIRHLLQSFTKNRFAAFLTGTVTTSIVQSSSAVSVMVISLVKAGLLSFPKTFGILLGAGIGTTITAQIIAFKISDYALLIVALGFFLSIIPRKKILSVVGSALLGFGLLFYGLHLMSDAMVPLRDHQPFLNFLVKLQTPWTGVLAGFVFTAIIQSSSAFIGIIIVLASQGLLDLNTGVALLLGSNIGTTMTAILASMNAGYESKRVALAFFMIKLVGVLMIVLWIPQYARLVENISLLFSEQVPLTRLIANAHTVFNIIVTLLLLPLSNTFSKIIMKWIPEKKAKDDLVQLKYINPVLIDNPGVALSLAKKEVMHMGNFVMDMLTSIIDPFISKDTSGLPTIKINEDKVDYLRKEIAIYLTEISQGKLSDSLTKESFQILYINSEIEEIADIVSKVLAKKGAEWAITDKTFSEKGKQEILTLHKSTVEQFAKTLEVLDSLDKDMANKLKKEHKKFRAMADELKYKHFERISQNITESVKSSKLHMELVGALRIVHSHIANIMRVIAR